MRVKTSASIVAVLSFTSLLFACGGSGSSTPANPTGTLNLAVTDAPIDDISAVVIEFTGVSIKPATDEPIEFLFDTPRSINLLELQGNLSEQILTDATVPAGDYNWIRLHVNAEHDNIMDSYAETELGTQLELWIPSGSQTGLKLVRGFTVPAGGSADFTADFDLRKSIVAAPEMSGQGLKFKPVLRLVDNISAGSVSGIIDAMLITEACMDPAADVGAVYVFAGADVSPTDVSGAETDPLTTAKVSYDGEAWVYEVGFLQTGSYTLAYTCEAAMDDPEVADNLNFISSANAEITEGNETFLDFTIGDTSAKAVTTVQ